MQPQGDYLLARAVGKALPNNSPIEDHSEKAERIVQGLEAAEKMSWRRDKKASTGPGRVTMESRR